MSIDNVQLKQEEVVGNEIVLQDINPKTTTSSVTDESVGTQLDTTLDRIWDAINKKLSRIVNSVNGRTGVVVLQPGDVGLDKVDNVSFSDIKQWVINRMAKEFENKRIKLYHDLSEAQRDVDTNDMILKDSPYYAEHGYNDDMKAYIGYIFLDTGTGKLAHAFLPVNTVGKTDNSIIYDEEVNGVDLTGGGLGINIWKYEDALKVYNGSTKDESGIYIDKSKLAGDLKHYDGMYGDGTSDDTTALLYFDTTTTPKTAYGVKIFIDDRQVAFGCKIRQQLKKGDLIICDFKDYRTNDVVPSGMSPDLMFRNQCIGKVTQVPSSETGAGDYQIEFHTIKPNVGLGLQHSPTHQTGISDTGLSVKLADGHTRYFKTENSLNVSGLQARSGVGDPNPVDFTEPIPEAKEYADVMGYTVLPEGAVQVFQDKSKLNNGGGLYITPDFSMCVIPHAAYARGTDDSKSSERSRAVMNWVSSIPGKSYSLTDDYGFLSDGCSLGVNLLKAKIVKYESGSGDSLIFANASGLRITGNTELPSSPPTITVGLLGMTGDVSEDDSSKTTTGDTTGGIPFNSLTTGGLSVNVGKFLEISPGEWPSDASTYYDGGKVNVRLARGLSDDGNNRIEINIGQNSKDESQKTGLTFIDNDILAVNITEGGGLSVDDDGHLVVSMTTEPLTFVDGSNNEVEYTPAKGTKITLGPGLKLVLD